ncbi:MAG: hypothetical protein RJQ10_11510 [Haliea sp.]|uniref:hypothetical protein n=1 Tax=Haliea sp. TaxID=1932666 RepID=UPI0032EC890B
MGTRGKQSSAALSVAPLSERRPGPPETLTEAQAAIWKRIVGVYPADYFRPDSFDILAAYCRHVDAAAILNHEIDRYTSDWLTEDDGLKRYKTLLECRDRESRAAMALARSMRITHQSRYTEKAAASVQRRSGKPIWEV